MRTAQDYSDSLDKEAFVPLAATVGKYTAKLFGKKAGGYAATQTAKATRRANRTLGRYRGSDFGKKFGNKPLVAGGFAVGAAAGHVATGGQPLGYRPRV